MHLKIMDHFVILRLVPSNHLPRLFLSLTVLGLLGATCWHESGCWGWSSSKPSSARVFDGDMLGTGIFVSVRLQRLNLSTGCGGRIPAGLWALGWSTRTESRGNSNRLLLSRGHEHVCCQCAVSVSACFL